MSDSLGSISICQGGLHYTRIVEGPGWLAADMVQYLDDLYRSDDPSSALLKLLGIDIRILRRKPPRRGVDHWVWIDLDARVLETNSPMIRKAVDRQPTSVEDPYGPGVLERIYEVLDRKDFSVKFVR